MRTTKKREFHKLYQQIGWRSPLNSQKGKIHFREMCIKQQIPPRELLRLIKLGAPCKIISGNYFFDSNAFNEWYEKFTLGVTEFENALVF